MTQPNDETDPRPASLRIALPLALAIVRVGQQLRRRDLADPRLPLLREYLAAVRTRSPAPRDASPGWLEEWEQLLGLGPHPLRQRPAGQLCDRCDWQGAPIVSQEVKNYGHRATCPQCGEAWVVLLSPARDR